MPMRNVLILGLAVMAWVGCSMRAARLRYATIISHAIADVSRLYVEPVDHRDLFEGAMTGLVASLDENSEYIPPTRYTELREDLDQEFVGVGVEISTDLKTDHILVVSPLYDSPAYRAGIRAGDLIVSVEGVDTATVPLEQSIRLMKGPPGTTVRLEVLPYGQTDPRELVLERARVAIVSLRGDTRNPDGTWNYVLETDPTIGYIRIGNFGEATAQEFRDAMQKLDGTISGLILDVRDNPGGLLTAALELCDMFVDEGVIVTIRGRGGVINDTYRADPDATIVPRELPVVVLVNEFSASASEILAACLQDHGRARIVGQRTWGKGTVQRVFELEAGRSALKFTTDTYWRPSGKNIHRSERSREDNDLSGEWGVRPLPEDVVIVALEEHRKVLLWRRERDAVQLDAPKTADDASSADALVDTEKVEPVEDRQLTRAIEVIDELRR